MLSFPRFSAMTRDWVNRDMQLHTNWTDGQAAVVDVIRRAEELDLSEIAFTEHVRADTEWFPRFADEVRQAAEGSPVRVLVGAETRITDFEGTLDISDPIRSECDLILASVHRFPGPDGKPVAFDTVSREAFAETEYRLALGFLSRGGADVLAHPGGMSLRQLGRFPENYFRSLAVECRRSNIALEINASYLRDFEGFLALLSEEDPPVSIGSDAHTLDELGRCRDLLLEALWPNG